MLAANAHLIAAFIAQRLIEIEAEQVLIDERNAADALKQFTRSPHEAA